MSYTTSLGLVDDTYIDLARSKAESYRTALPFPHAVFDGFLPEEVLRAVQEAFPGPEDASWYSYNNRREAGKLTLREERYIPSVLVELLRELNGQRFLEFLTQLTGIEGLISDPYLVGGGLHQILPGGSLKVHADFNLHPDMRLERRVNVLLYLNDDWEESFGGHLELWDEQMSTAVRRIAPIANRLAIFSTTKTSFHGHPDPLACPQGRSRRSLAWYYYSVPGDSVSSHSTLFKARPGEVTYTRREALVESLRKRTPDAVKRLVRQVRPRRGAW